MRRTPLRRGPRAGFTLVELLVVITILAILFALTAAAVVKVLGKGDEAKVRHDIQELQTAIQAFKTDFQVGYLPDRFVLPPALDPTGESLQYVTTLWPRINATYLQNTPAARTAWGIGSTSGNQVCVLQGHQTLVFFLGGARDASGIPIGFSNSATDPLNTTLASRKGPYYEFPLDRLVVFPFGNPTGAPWTNVTPVTANTTTYKSFLDVFGTQPYIYFSSKKAGNDYNNAAFDKQFNCAPFVLSATRFANPNGFQIISAGKDQLFGAGANNWPGAGGSTSQNGYDDWSNFHPIMLGIPNN